MHTEVIAHHLKAGLRGAEKWVERHNLDASDPIRLKVAELHSVLHDLHVLTHDGGIQTESGGTPK